MRKTLALISLGFFLSTIPAGASLSKENVNTVKGIVSRYQQSAMVEMDLEKKVTSEILGREKVYKGKTFLAAKRFRLELFEPEKSLIVFDGTTLWNVQYPPEGSEGKIQVAKAKLDKKNQSQILLGDLLIEQGLTQKFDLLTSTKTADSLEVSAKPKNSQIQVTDLKFRLDLKEKVIKEIEYSDELGNKTLMKFSGTRFQKKKTPKLFQYQPEKGAQVTEL